MFTKDWFLDLDDALRAAGLDSDSSSFDEIKSNLQNRKILNPTEFATAAAYVILAGGFSQKTAKRKHAEIMNYLTAAATPNVDGLLKIFNNKNKMNAILKIWRNRKGYCDEYYAIASDENHKSEIINQKLRYLAQLPHIGKITANHLARNLGENVVKYDIWIQRLGVAFATQSPGCKVQISDIDNAKLNPEIKKTCDKMFAHLENETGLPRGYIDVVLWKACQNKLIKIPHLLD